MISASAGDDESLRNIGICYRNKLATKNHYEQALRTHQKAKKEVSSDERKMSKKFLNAGQDWSVLSEAELASLCGVRKAERAHFSRHYQRLIGMTRASG